MKNLFRSVVAVIIAIITLLATGTTAPAEDITEDKSDIAAEDTSVDGAIEYDESKLGDVNNDGKVNAADARILIRCSANLDSISVYVLTYGDYNKDNRITASDARTALRVAASIEKIYCILNGHDLAAFEVKPTCTKEGYTTQKCKRCYFTDGSRTNIVPAAGHKLVKNTTKATCTQPGLFTSVCSVCDHTAEKKEAEAALGHNYSGWKETASTRSRICKRCGFTDTVKIQTGNGKTIYLTFDDGPGPYTKKLLGYLKKYDVKATFFVTNQNPNYTYLLSDIVKDGHAIGVHSLTHSWSIYSSENSFLKDFNAMHKIIKDETGVDTKIFRFPGGTNNTVSRSYSRGIMASLAETMTEKGYLYFDWDVDCGDTAGYSSNKIAQTTINQIKGRKTAIVLMHDIKYRTVEAVNAIIEFGLNNGYEFKVLDESSPAVRFKPVN